MRRVFFVLAMGLIVTFAAMPVSAQPWNLRIVDNAGDMGGNSRIAVTSDGTPYILYLGGDTYYPQVYLAWWVPSGPGSGGWGRTYIGQGYGPSTYYATTALVADDNDNAHLSWMDNSYNLYYAQFSTITRNLIIPPEIVASASRVKFFPSISILNNGGSIQPIISYSSGYSSWDYDLYFATRDSITGTWSSKPIYTEPGSVGSVVSMAASSTGRIYISFYETTSKDLMYTTKAPSDTTWATGYIDITDDVGNYNSIVLDENDIPHVVYYDATSGDLKYAKVVTP